MSVSSVDSSAPIVSTSVVLKLRANRIASSRSERIVHAFSTRRTSTHSAPRVIRFAPLAASDSESRWLLKPRPTTSVDRPSRLATVRPLRRSKRDHIPCSGNASCWSADSDSQEGGLHVPNTWGTVGVPLTPPSRVTRSASALVVARPLSDSDSGEVSSLPHRDLGHHRNPDGRRPPHGQLFGPPLPGGRKRRARSAPARGHARRRAGNQPLLQSRMARGVRSGRDARKIPHTSGARLSAISAPPVVSAKHRDRSSSSL